MSEEVLHKKKKIHWYPSTTEGWIATIGVGWSIVALSGLLLFWVLTEPVVLFLGIASYAGAVILLLIALVYICHMSRAELEGKL